jgi:hypothetical protein
MSNPTLKEHDAMVCRACGKEERASEGYPCAACGTFICTICSMRGVQLCASCAARDGGRRPGAAGGSGGVPSAR